MTKQLNLFENRHSESPPQGATWNLCKASTNAALISCFQETPRSPGRRALSDGSLNFDIDFSKLLHLVTKKGDFYA